MSRRGYSRKAAQWRKTAGLETEQAPVISRQSLRPFSMSDELKRTLLVYMGRGLMAFNEHLAKLVMDSSWKENDS